MNSFNILENWCHGIPPHLQDLEFLLTEALEKSQEANAFSITPENGLEKIKTRSQLFKTVQGEVQQLCQQLGFKESQPILLMLWRLWLPLALQLVQAKQQLNRPLIQGILGGQGTGKTTLAKVCQLILSYLGYTTVGISLDDLYKTYAERQQVQTIDSRLIWRGPPGTHDIQLGIKLLDQFRQTNKNQPILVPRFDKSLHNGAGDRVKFETINKADIVLFEGWFVGVQPVEETRFNYPLPPILTEADQKFARDMNEKLKDYLPLWERLDRLIVLYPINYQLSKQWRKEAEHKMIASGKTGMTDTEIEEFVNYFWRSLHPELFITPLIQNPKLVDLVIEIKPDHSVSKIYHPTQE